MQKPNINTVHYIVSGPIYCRMDITVGGDDQLELADELYFSAKEWFGRAAVRGYARAQYALGRFYENGHGVEQKTNTMEILLNSGDYILEHGTTVWQTAKAFGVSKSTLS